MIYMAVIKQKCNINSSQWKWEHEEGGTSLNLSLWLSHMTEDTDRHTAHTQATIFDFRETNLWWFEASLNQIWDHMLKRRRRKRRGGTQLGRSAQESPGWCLPNLTRLKKLCHLEPKIQQGWHLDMFLIYIKHYFNSPEGKTSQVDDLQNRTRP